MNTMTYVASEGFVTREIAGEVLAVPVGAMTQKLNGMITFSPSGALLWKMLQEPCTEEALTAALAAQYGKAPCEVEEDVRAFVAGALARGLVAQRD